MHYEKIHLYPNREDVSLKAYILDDSPEIRVGKPRGAVLICPGGAYLFCSDRESEPVALAFAAMGYHAFVLRYSTYNEDNALPDLTASIPEKPHAQFPNPMRDIAKAILYIRSRAAEWLVDTGKIALCGFSAGGHNCAMYSVYWDKPIIADFFGVERAALRPAASILCYPMTDYFLLKKSIQDDEQAGTVHRAANIAYFGTEMPSEEMLLQASPARLVSESTPPTFIWTTAEDIITPATQATAMAHALASHNIPFEMHIFERGIHGLSLASHITAGESKEYVDMDAAQWVKLCERWLRKRL